MPKFNFHSMHMLAWQKGYSKISTHALSKVIGISSPYTFYFFFNVNHSSKKQIIYQLNMICFLHSLVNHELKDICDKYLPDKL